MYLRIKLKSSKLNDVCNVYNMYVMYIAVHKIVGLKYLSLVMLCTEKTQHWDTSLKYTPTQGLRFSKSHRWLRSIPSFCCLMLTIPSSPTAMEIHSAHQLPARVWACVCFWCAASVSWWGRPSPFYPGNGTLIVLLEQEMKNVLHVPPCLPVAKLSNGLMRNSKREQTYLLLQNLPHFQSHMAPFIPIKLWSVSRFAFWTRVNLITLVCS